MLRRARAAAWALLEAVAPPECGACGADVERWDQVACGPCRDTFERLRPPWCAVCGVPFESADGGVARACGRCAAIPPPYTEARAFGAYGGGLEGLIAAFKYRDRRDLADPLAALVVIGAERGLEGVDLVTAVPLAPARLRQRGYDQAWLLAQSVARMLDLPATSGVLRRTRDTPPQTSLSATGRRDNVRGAFDMGVEPVAGRDVLLIDDVVTTGATAGECARILMRSGAARVRVAAVARAV